MNEQIINIEEYNPVEILGVHDNNLQIVKSFYPKLKIIARGSEIKVLGEANLVDSFCRKFRLLLTAYDHFGKITENDILQIFESRSDSEAEQKAKVSKDVLVHGRHGKLIRPKTKNQHKMVEATNDNDLVIAIGPAGTGKTYTAVALAVRALKNKEVKRIILARPAVEAGENLGFLPGDLKDKLDPYLQPLYDALRDMMPTQRLLSYIEDGTIEIAPLAFMRGRTLNDAFAILDEAQNATPSQLKMFLTRMGVSSKFIVTGDITQIDLPGNLKSGLIHADKILKNINGIKFIHLDESDIIRHNLVSKIINAYTKDENNK